MDAVIQTDPAQFCAQSQKWNPGASPTEFVPEQGFTQYTVNIPIALFTSLATEFAKQLKARSYGPAVLVPGDVGAALTPTGSLLTIGANGEVYSDGEQLPGIAARQIVRFGLSVYAQGKTQPTWWRWTGLKWVQVMAFDPAILKDL